MKIPKTINKVIRLLEEAGYEAVVVGGAVRDYLLGIVPSDYDISTNARPEQIKEVFHKYHMLEIGIKHGTITVFIEGKQVEITTYRSEKDYEDFRHPKQIIFEDSLDEDLKRRDFTINAICYNKRLIDRVGGIKDINTKTIRAIGSPKARFSEDALRILRALRFASTLDFQIEEETSKAIFSLAPLLRMVSFERINIELSKLLLGKAVIRVLDKYLNVFQILIPELPNNLDDNLKIIKETNSLAMRLAALLLDLDLNISEGILKRLKYPKTKIREVLFLLKNKDLEIDPEKKEIGKLLKNIDIKELIHLINFQIAIKKANYQDFQSLKKALEILQNIDPNKCYQLKDLAISGRHLLDLGYQEGIGIRLLLDKLLDLVIDGSLDNEEEVLLNYSLNNYPNRKNPLAK